MGTTLKNKHMAFKMRSGNKVSFKEMGSSPLKQKTIDGKTYPESYTKEDVKFLKEQREDVVRRSDFDEGSKEQKLFDANQAKRKAKAVDKKFKDKEPMKQVKRPKTKSPAKQEGKKLVAENTGEIKKDKKGKDYALVMENSVNFAKGDTIRPGNAPRVENYIMGGDYKTKKKGKKNYKITGDIPPKKGE